MVSARKHYTVLEACGTYAAKLSFSSFVQTLVNLLGARDTSVLLGALLALASLAER